jgi:DmsE family decaheme c-type cytochrome
MPSTKQSRSLRRHCLFLAVAAQFCLLTSPAGAARPPVPKKFGDEYVGAEVCQSCHEDLFNNLMKTSHRIVNREERLGWKDHACESCHGPGADHAGSADPTKIVNPAKVTAERADKICLSCHLNTAKQSDRIQSSHMKDAVSCVACHTVHASTPAGLVARTAPQINALCTSCHLDVKAQFAKPFRHKIPENEMTCVDCHNPHGSGRQSMIETFAVNEPGCFKCHGDKRGPFTFEHAPVKYEGCGTCHEAHGSVNPRMLTRHEVRFACLECHSNLPAVGATATKVGNSAAGVVPPAIHDLRSPRYQNCTVCHQKVHGSNADRFLLR